MTSSIPAALAAGPGLHARVRVELTNGTIILGRLVEMDPATMNTKIDALSATAVLRTVNVSDEEAAAKDEAVFHAQQKDQSVPATQQQKHITDMNPLAVQCIQSIVIRGACIKYLDYLPDDGSASGNSVDDVIAAVSHIRPTE